MAKFEEYITDDLLNSYLQNEGSDYSVNIASVTKQTGDDLWVDMDLHYRGELLGRYGYSFISSAGSYGGYTEQQNYKNIVLNLMDTFIDDMDDVLREQNIKKLINKI